MPKPAPRARPPRPADRSAPRSPATGEKRVVISLSVPPGLLRQFDAVALRQNRSRAGMLMTIMQQAVESERS
jgi:CopG-like RHH_1 or ribbon-helix-helix domain, RHH_5